MTFALKLTEVNLMMSLITWYLVIVLLEYSLGMGPGVVHVDEVTYLTKSEDYCQSYGVFGLGYFCYVKYLNSNVLLISIFGFVQYIVHSMILVRSIRLSELRGLSLIFAALLLFDPYKVHLFSHVLKESFVVLILSIVLFSRKLPIIFLALVLGTWFRFWFLLYAFAPFLILFLTRYLIGRSARINLIWKIVLTLGLGFLFNYFSDGISSILKHLVAGGNGDMIFQMYDNVPTFNTLGLFGDILRAIVWPILTLTGAFFLLSPAVLYFPLAIHGLLVLGFIFSLRSI